MKVTLVVLALVVLPLAGVASAQTEVEKRIDLSGKIQTAHLYRPAHPPRAVAVLASGDLGWMGFAVDVAHMLQAHDVAVLGLNTRAYLASFTDGKKALDPEAIPGHFDTLATEAERLLAPGAGVPVVLVGISEGAGLAMVASSTETRHRYRGVIGLGTPETIELGWNTWKDWTIWITKGDPKQPHLTITPHVARVAPVPMVLLQSTHDEFIPPEETERLFAAAREPKRLVPIDAKNHRFSDRQPELQARLLEALEWVRSVPR